MPSSIPTTPTPTPLALRPREAAKALGISLRHLHTLNASGRLPRPIALGRSRRWLANELKSWLEAGAPSRNKWEAMRDGGAP